MTPLDEQIQAFVDQSLGHDPVDATRASAHEQRQWYNAKCKEIAAPLADGIQVQDDTMLGSCGHLVPVRHYLHKDRTNIDQAKQIVFLHGGGFVVGNLDSHHDICGQLAKDTGFDLVSVDYRLAPEYQYPDDINDCLTVVDNLLKKGQKLVLVGDSAGGTLSACVANARKRYVGTQLLGQVLIYPSLTFGVDTPSMTEHAFAPLLSKEDMDYYLPVRVGGDLSIMASLGGNFMPMQTLSYSGLPVTHLFPAQIDPLRDDCELYAHALQAANVEVTNHLALGQGLVHGHLRARNMSDKASANFQAICSAVRDLGK
jgi:acetyl esterase